MPKQQRNVLFASLWGIAGRLGTRVIDLCLMLILARLLTPADFGLVAKAMSLVLIFEAVADLPLTTALLRIDRPTRDHYDTAFTLGGLRALTLGGTLCLLAWPAAWLFAEPRITALLLVLSIGAMCRGSLSPRMVDFLRAFDTRQRAIIQWAGKLASLVISANLAWSTGSYWALAVGMITSPLVMVALSYWIAPYRPRLSLREWPEFRDYVGWNTATQVIRAVNWQIDRILLGRQLPSDGFGRYTMALDLSYLPLQVFALSAVEPLMARFVTQKDRQALGQGYLHAGNAILFCVGPLYILMSVLSEPVVRIILGTQWQDTSGYLSLAAIAVIPQLCHVALPELAARLRQAHLVTLRFLAEAALRVPLMVMGIIIWGVQGALIALITSNVLTLIISGATLHRLTGIGFGHQILTLGRSFVMLAVFWVMLENLVPPIDLHVPIWLQLGHCLLVAGLGLLGYLVVSLWAWTAMGRPDGIERRIAKLLKFPRHRVV